MPGAWSVAMSGSFSEVAPLLYLCLGCPKKRYTSSPLHDDYEDNLVVAAAQRSRADCLVTNNEKLLRHSPVATLSCRDAAIYLRAMADASLGNPGDRRREHPGSGMRRPK